MFWAFRLKTNTGNKHSCLNQGLTVAQLPKGAGTKRLTFWGHDSD